MGKGFNIMWFKQDCWDEGDELKTSKAKVSMPNGFSGKVSINLVYRKFPTDAGLTAFKTEVRCKTQDDFDVQTTSMCERIKVAGEILKNAKEDEIVTLFDSLVIKKSQFISLNLDTLVDKYD